MTTMTTLPVTILPPSTSSVPDASIDPLSSDSGKKPAQKKPAQKQPTQKKAKLEESMEPEKVPSPPPPTPESVHSGGDVDAGSDLEDLEERSVDESDAGSLVDFVVNDPDGENEEKDEDSASDTSEAPQTREEAIRRDLDGIDTSNLVTGKRVRKQTQFYEQQVFNTKEYKKMMLCDISKEDLDEMEAEEDGEEEGEEEEDEEEESFEEGEGESSEEENDDEYTGLPSEALAKTAKKVEKD